MIVTAVHAGESSFRVDVVPRDTEVATPVLNAVGLYAGQTLCSCRPGAHELQVVADGRWTIRLTVPVLTAAAIDLPENLAGWGSRVIVVASHTERRMHVTTTHLGASNFIVSLTEFGDTKGSELLTNDIGLVHDVTAVDVPQGAFLLQIEADGAWEVRFDAGCGSPPAGHGRGGNEARNRRAR